VTDIRVADRDREAIRDPSSIFHIHPTLRCNLACAHCYSSSSPTASAQLPADLVCRAIEDAAALGFGVLSVSGGEPLLYDALGEVLACARACGMRTQIATNGWFLADQRYARVADLIDLVAVSVDGSREVHNHLRGSPRAFDRLESGLAHLRGLGRRFGLIHTVTAQNWESLFETADFAVRSGAALLQFHVIENAGRATTDAAELLLEEDDVARAYIVAALLRTHHAGAMEVRIDLQHKSQQRAEAQTALDIIVLESSGTIAPLAYGFDPRFAICNIHDQRLRDAWVPFCDTVYPSFEALRSRLDDDLQALEGPAIFNWYERMVAGSLVS
jgi:MoaA/NifB/PqqE/SkfB family radical SAM enzyme